MVTHRCYWKIHFGKMSWINSKFFSLRKTSILPTIILHLPLFLYNFYRGNLLAFLLSPESFPEAPSEYLEIWGYLLLEVDFSLTRCFPYSGELAHTATLVGVKILQ